MTRTDVPADLRALLPASQVLSDFASLTAYAVDASIYRVAPQAIALIESEADLVKLLDYARARGVPLTARCGGTNLTGNALGSGIILEFSRLRRLLAIDAGAALARVEPGLVLSELDRRLRPHGLMFGPDPSSGDMCQLGGMIGNNAAGPHTLKYGATKDNVVALRVLTADGRPLIAQRYAVGSDELRRLATEHAAIGRVLALLGAHGALIRSRRRQVSKNSSGYNLFDLADAFADGWFDLHKLIVGSEGTLALVTEATLRLVPRPPRRVAALAFLTRLEQVGDAVNALLELAPSALELLDASTLDLVGRERHGVPAAARSMLLIEFDAEPLARRAETAAALLARFDLAAPPRFAWEEPEQEAFWRIRKAIYPTLYRFDAARKPINFVDDVVVPARRLPELIAYLEKLLASEGVPVAIYGHVGDGNAHINPLMDLRSPGEVERMARLARAIHATVIERFDGSLCGEHGDGRLRAEFLPALYGPELYQLFVKVKRAFDPDGILNPGVKLAATAFTENLDAARLAKGCATCGKCNVVCPAHDVAREESNAARGWFHILTDQNYSYDKAGRVVEACLNCKSCRVVCPAGIDVSAVVLERRAERPNALAGAVFRLQHQRTRLFETLLRAAAWTQPIWDRSLTRRLLDVATRPLLRALAPTARLAADVRLPRLARRTLRARHGALTPESGHTGTVAYFHGCAANYFDDGVGDAVIRLLARVGVRPVLPAQRCSGTPIETYGHRDLVAANAAFNLTALAGFDTVVTGCASCTYMLKDYERFAATEDQRAQARQLAGRVRHISEYLVRDRPIALPGGTEGSQAAGATGDPPPPIVVYHSSCHLRAAGVTEEPKQLLRGLPRARFREMRDAERCAGGAGTFIVKNYEQAQAIFARKRAAIEDAGAEIVATSCPACMIQLATGLDGRLPVKHIAQLLDEQLPRPPD